jgi:hypothetical protein
MGTEAKFTRLGGREPKETMRLMQRSGHWRDTATQTSSSNLASKLYRKL